SFQFFFFGFTPTIDIEPFFFISFMILSNATKTIANAIKYVILSTIKYNTPFRKGAETAATVSLHLTL
ncbi:MAG: hypothetical protein ACLRQ1_04080, partial [Ruminococcus sp.]|uniref:hypothetical protein n=1 Tax=Ruminococcus sp. TaxID=41978 RepID=UPI0039909D3F